ncbi:efflux RND transporter periplasmic adaptor subunit [Lutimonas vermicola]|uniref:Efflux RND transporter periplasmic adaptor subunit n=1 Tax=Lutimonas vermicola TaxID=414288 RepID=A0ABU9L2G6_9FLAO
MKNILPLFIIAILLASCGNGDKKSVEAVIESRNLESIRAKKSELVSEQNLIKREIKKLDIAIEELDAGKRIPLITSFKLEETEFRHFLELQGNVTTKNLLMIYPEFSGVLSNVYVKEGQKVEKGQILAKIDDGGLSQQLAQLKIQADLAKTTFERQQRLWDQKIGSEMQYLQAKSNYEAQNQAIAQLEQQVAKTIVRAPFSGTIDDVLTEQGSVVMPGQSELMRIVNLDNMYIVTDVPEKYITTITKNKKVEVEFPVLGIKIESKVRQVGDFINPDNRTFKVEISVPNKEKSIKPNLTAKLRINDYSNEKALLIPQSVISENASGEQYVYVVKDKTENNEATAEKLIIETGLTQGDYIEVTKGLTSGSEVIMEGARSVNDGQKVKIINQDA